MLCNHMISDQYKERHAVLAKALQDEKEALQAERDSLKTEIEEAQIRLQQVEERLTLVVSLMNHTDGAKPTGQPPLLQEQPPAIEVAFQILSEREGETMHYKALADEVILRRGDIPGDNAAQVLVARLVNDERFVRPARRGFYGLRKDYPNAKNVGQRKANKNARSRNAA